MSNETAEITDAITVEKFIAADAEVIFPYFTEAEKVKAWYCVDAELDPRPGGICRLDHTGGDDVTMYHSLGEFIEVSPYTRVIYTWGYTDSDMGDLPQNGNSTIQVDLIPQDGGTLVRLAHSGLNANVRSGFGEGNGAILDMLAEIVEAEPIEKG